MIQLAILGAPRKPVELDTFLAPIINEIKNLSTNGMIIRKAGVDICKARVHLMAATGKKKKMIILLTKYTNLYHKKGIL